MFLQILYFLHPECLLSAYVKEMIFSINPVHLSGSWQYPKFTELGHVILDFVAIQINKCSNGYHNIFLL